MNRFALPLFLNLVACGQSESLDSAISQHWNVVWADDFDGPANSSPNEDHWNFDIGNGDNGWGNQQLEYDTPYVSNVALNGDGFLHIIAREESYGGFNYTSGRIHTRDKVTLGYGRYEARLQMPFGQGLWPAFWLLGSQYPDVGWPDCGEVDIMELDGAYPLELHGTVHGPGYSGGLELAEPTPPTRPSPMAFMCTQWRSNQKKSHFGLMTFNTRF